MANKAVIVLDGATVPQDLATNINQAGLLAARPAAGHAGVFFLATDVAGGTMYRDNGVTWDAIAPGATSGATGTAGGDLTGTYPNPTLSNQTSAPNRLFTLRYVTKR